MKRLSVRRVLEVSMMIRPDSTPTRSVVAVAMLVGALSASAAERELDSDPAPSSTVRNTFDAILRNQAFRLAHAKREPTREDLMTLPSADIVVAPHATVGGHETYDQWRLLCLRVVRNDR